MNPLSKLILENTDKDARVNIALIWNKIWKLGYSREQIRLQAMKLGLAFETLIFSEAS